MEVQEPSAAPSKVQVKLASPDVVSAAEPVKEIGLIYQPFVPAVPLKAPLITGNSESTFTVIDPMVELSPHEERAQ
jgi:hypothetical protein